MKDYLVKAIDKTKNLRLITVDAKDLVSEAQKRHDTWSASSAVLQPGIAAVCSIGTLLTAASVEESPPGFVTNRFAAFIYSAIFSVYPRTVALG